MVMYWFIEGLSEFKEKFLRMIIYCILIKDVFEMYLYVIKELFFILILLEMFYFEIL